MPKPDAPFSWGSTSNWSETWTEMLYMAAGLFAVMVIGVPLAYLKVRLNYDRIKKMS